ncbi:MAG: hypothetical protein IPN71_01575 [Fibrobacteres bacterium]|jgi:hypothetical protein|nr:hypothetical protein [Fibrobacterota bacterium]
MKPRLYWLSLFAWLAGCSFGDREAGKGIITETTNGVSARGRIVTADSVPVVSGTVVAVQDANTPDAWEGKPRASGKIQSNGSYQLAGLDQPKLVFYANATNADGNARQGVMKVSVDGPDDFVAPDLVVALPGYLEGTYAAYDSVSQTLTGAWKLRIVVRGLGITQLLDSAHWRFDSIPPGFYHYRIQKVDWIPGHETTVFEDSMSSISVPKP